MEGFDTTLFNVEELTELRHWFHKNAELSYKEFKTQAKIKEVLVEKFKIPAEWIRVCGNTGLILDMQGTGPALGEAFTMALRCDHDGLPIKEDNPHLEYKSDSEAAHMCGHDGHTTCMLGGISIMFKNLDKIPSNKRIRILFQPAEEEFEGTIRGAMLMINDGCLEGVDEIYGLHNHPMPDETSEIKVAVKEMMALCNQVYITIKGVAGHGSAPEKCNNPIPVSARVYMQMFDALTKYQEKNELVRFSFTSFNAGHTFNVIPSEVKISGSLRSFYMNQNDEMEEIIKEIVAKVCKDHDCDFDLRFKKGAGAVVNTPSCSSLVSKVAKEMYGDDKVDGEGLPIYGAEDFADFLKFVPGAFFFRVTRNLPPGVNIHHHQYDFDDSVIEDLSKLWFKIVLERLNQYK